MSLAELKKVVGNSKLILGTDKTFAELKKGMVKKVFLAVNCGKIVKEDIEANAKSFGVEVSQLSVTSEELGVVVKKPFPVAVAALLK